jgi:hypothetical protein
MDYVFGLPRIAPPQGLAYHIASSRNFDRKLRGNVKE